MKGDEVTKRPYGKRPCNADDTRRVAQQQDQAKAFEAADRFETKPRDKTGRTGVINPWAILQGPDREEE